MTYEGLKKKELQDLCKERELLTSGNIPDLKARLEENDATIKKKSPKKRKQAESSPKSSPKKPKESPKKKISSPVKETSPKKRKIGKEDEGNETKPFVFSQFNELSKQDKKKMTVFDFVSEVNEEPVSKPKGSPKKKKDPNAPKRPMNAFLVFCLDARAGVKAENPSASGADIRVILAQKWKAMGAMDKSKYKDTADEEKETYQKAKKKYEAAKAKEKKKATPEKKKVTPEKKKATPEKKTKSTFDFASPS